jgi:hypothetical protein
LFLGKEIERKYVALPSIIPGSHRMRVEEKAVCDKLQNLALRIGQGKISKLGSMH